MKDDDDEVEARDGAWSMETAMAVDIVGGWDGRRVCRGMRFHVKAAGGLGCSDNKGSRGQVRV